MKCRWLVAAACASVLLGTSLEAAESSAANVIERYDLQEADTPVKERKGWRKPKRILVGGMASRLGAELKAAAPDVEFIAAGTPEAKAKIASIDAVFGFCDADTLSAGKSIQWIQMVTAGVENCVSLPAIKERNILVTNMQRIAGPIIAEHVIAMTMALARGLDVYIPAQAQGQWIPRLPPGRATTVDGKTMLVVGLGGIGSEVAKRAHALGMKVTATRNSGRSGPDFVSYVGLSDELPKLAAEADFVVNTAPLTPQTKGMFNAAFFGKMKPTAYFINIARGGSVVTSDLVDALNNKTIAGAALDVTDPEPLPAGHPLWKAPNLILTPHVSADSDLGSGAQLAVVRENLKRYSAGDKMLSVVDVTRGY
ncbi:2-hydroxyacid dehydrogenase [Steroidobacter agaridevorans]|uniref:2-hydroxyacid dehydrogenase n=1 Tax=Steroidobacter agaridevorans TaxID=2695856 RepID=A0A829Y6U2_9GAMM|nr:D-2-hydroxyacid dehydrogenase [Steroidobacter agaridevorans]GFE78974.1 2-hydroxyacid dehydrogenase [Steroidobacter agaridevorans]GFE88129.1 2-hydroxyacid dehydrogenase [Steroidobacter agaridevorans]